VTTGGGAGRADVRVWFEADVWEEEIGRLRPGSPMRQAAEAGRARLETEHLAAGWMPCEAEGPDGTSSPVA
jgi:hypothetical protein